MSLKNTVCAAAVRIAFGSVLTAFAYSAYLPSSFSVPEQSSLQRGARIFMNYCSGCHSLKYLRYNRMAKDLAIVNEEGQVNEPLLKGNLLFTQVPVFAPIESAMPADEAQQWFGVAPPDLSLIVRQRGALWLYDYLQGFYPDDSRPLGTNNRLIPNVAMPDILEPLRGQRSRMQNLDLSLYQIAMGEDSAAQFDQVLFDLVNFLAYVAEPTRLLRYQLGFAVITFLFVFLLLAIALKRSYWYRQFIKQ